MRPELRRVGNEQTPDRRDRRIYRLLEKSCVSPIRSLRIRRSRTIIIQACGGSSNPPMRPRMHYVEQVCSDASQFIAGAFDVDGFELGRGEFLDRDDRPSELSLPQRAPHFDSPDPKYYALLHYVRVPKGSGTAFYRQRSTGIERVTEANIGQFISTAQREAELLPATPVTFPAPTSFSNTLARSRRFPTAF